MLFSKDKNNGEHLLEAVMSLPHSVSEILKNHVTLEIEGIDRMYLNCYVPKLQREIGAFSFFKFHRGQPIPSSLLMAEMTRSFIQKIQEFADDHKISVVEFKKGQRKDTVMLERLKKFSRKEGVVFIGKAQEKVQIIRTQKVQSLNTGKKIPWLVKSTAMVNQYYFYAVDENFGPFFLKFNSYFPYNAKLCLNGHEYLKCQLAKQRIKFEALDNGLLSCEDPKRAQKICDGLCEIHIDHLLRKWLKILPHPFLPKDRKAGYRYDLSILQSEFSLTQVLDKPSCGRIFFEEVIRENLDIGRPSQVALIFNRKVTKATPGRFRTRVITRGVTPSLHVDYKSSKIKQYHKEDQQGVGRGLRTETTINNTRDFAIGKRLKNLPLLREVGFSANRRLLDVQKISHDCQIGEDTFGKYQGPVVVAGQRASGLRFACRKVQALLHALVLFRLLPHGFSNRDLKEQLAPLLGKCPSQITQGQMTYQLRRLRLHGVIERIPKSHRYQVTSEGLKTALFYTRSYNRLLRPGFSQIAPMAPKQPYPLRKVFDKLEQVMNIICRENKIAA